MEEERERLGRWLQLKKARKRRHHTSNAQGKLRVVERFKRGYFEVPLDDQLGEPFQIVFSDDVRWRRGLKLMHSLGLGVLARVAQH